MPDLPRGAVLALVLVTGALFATQPPLNALVARQAGALQAAFVSLAVSTAILFALLLVTGGLGGLGALAGMPLTYWLAGVVGAVNLTVALVAVRVLGAGASVAALVCTQLITAAILDRFGVLGLEQLALAPVRAAGIVLLLAGTLLVTLR